MTAPADSPKYDIDRHTERTIESQHKHPSEGSERTSGTQMWFTAFYGKHIA